MELTIQMFVGQHQRQVASHDCTTIQTIRSLSISIITQQEFIDSLPKKFNR